jgi:hypothetical protein
MIAVGVLALLVFVLFGALLELYRDVRQLRDVAGILDRPLNVDIGPVVATEPSRYGLPPALDSTGSALVLFLSETCSTCRAIAASFETFLPAGLWVVVEARSAESASAFVASNNLGAMIPSGRVCVDVAGQIAARLGLDTTPVGFRIENGLITSATTVPSVRYLSSVLPKPLRLKRWPGDWERTMQTNPKSEDAGARPQDVAGGISAARSSARGTAARVGMALMAIAAGRPVWR